MEFILPTWLCGILNSQFPSPGSFFIWKINSNKKVYRKLNVHVLEQGGTFCLPLKYRYGRTRSRKKHLTKKKVNKHNTFLGHVSLVTKGEDSPFTRHWKWNCFALSKPRQTCLVSITLSSQLKGHFGINILKILICNQGSDQDLTLSFNTTDFTWHLSAFSIWQELSY